MYEYDIEKRPDAVADIEAAAAWLADRPEIDGDRLIAKGGSYGGFMVLAALTEYPERWAAGIDIVGIANLVTFLINWYRKCIYSIVAYLNVKCLTINQTTRPIVSQIVTIEDR